jgi:hypothetical protein
MCSKAAMKTPCRYLNASKLNSDPVAKRLLDSFPQAFKNEPPHVIRRSHASNSRRTGQGEAHHDMPIAARKSTIRASC